MARGRGRGRRSRAGSGIRGSEEARRAYRIEYSPETETHLRVLTAAQIAIVLDEVDRQLRFEPTTPTRNRKPMRSNPVAPWELRIGDLRVYYDVESAPAPTVLVRAVGIKTRNEVHIGGEVVEL